MNRFVVLLLIGLLVPALLAHQAPKNNEHNEDKDKGKGGICRYKSTKGVEYDLRLLEHKAIVDYQYFDPATRNTFYFRPCGMVKTTGCEASSVCMVNANGKAVNFGTTTAIQWADGSENGASIEASYGLGEPCNNGVHRKTIVEYVCNLNAQKSSITQATFDDCSATFVLESPYVCPVANYCKSIGTPESCSSQDGLCKWKEGQCMHEDKPCGLAGHFSHAPALFAIILITSTGALLACTLGLCICACRRRRARICRSRSGTRRCGRKSSRKGLIKVKNVKKQPAAPKTDVEYAPFQMPFQLVPGGFAPINPYNNIQGYPMVTFVAPQADPEQQV